MDLINFSTGLPSKKGNSMIDDFFSRSISQFMGSDFVMNIPSVNIKETADYYLLELAVPGLEKDDFNIKVVNDLITISAETKSEEKTVDEKFKRREFNYASFSRSFPLPETVNTDAIVAGYENGILKISRYVFFVVFFYYKSPDVFNHNQDKGQTVKHRMHTNLVSNKMLIV